MKNEKITVNFIVFSDLGNVKGFSRFWFWFEIFKKPALWVDIYFLVSYCF